MTPPTIKNTIKMERKAENTIFIPQDSSFLASGNSMNEISKAMLKGIRIDLAKIKIAKSANTVAIT